MLSKQIAELVPRNNMMKNAKAEIWSCLSLKIPALALLEDRAC